MSVTDALLHLSWKISFVKVISEHSSSGAGPSDHVDGVRAAWARVWPELDTSPVGVVARVGRLAAFFDQGIDRAMAAHGLSRSSWDILATLRRGGPPFESSPTEMYRGLMRSSGWIANRLNRLERAGLITRHPDPDDARAIRVRLTERGVRLVDEVAPLHLANEERMLRALGPEDRERLAALLRALLVEMERDQPTPPGRRDRI
jgi:DNA-binding MarR family transcriptional regulator